MKKSKTLTEALKKASTERIEMLIEKLEKEQHDLEMDMMSLKMRICKCSLELQNRENK